VCGDVGEEEIRHVWRKAERCAATSCQELLYRDPATREDALPKLYRKPEEDPLRRYEL